MRVATAGMNEEEARFSVQVPLKQEALVWSDKYRPRKPRFFNRVHTVNSMNFHTFPSLAYVFIC